jgi:hypothetical protein
MVVAVLLVVGGLVLVLVSGVGAGAGAPVVSMWPANAEPASVRPRIVTAHSCRKGFTLGAS